MTRFLAAVLLALVFGSTPAFSERCALVISDELIVLRTFENNCPPDPAGKPSFKWLVAPVTTVPNFSPVTQVRTGPFYTVGSSEVTESWQVRSKTAQELDDDKTAAIDSIPKAIFLSLCYLNNQIGPDLTEAQCKTLFKGLLP